MENIDIIKEYKKGNIIIHDKYILYNIMSSYRKNKLFMLINNINRYIKEKKIGKVIQNDINQIVSKYNIILFNNRGISNKLDIIGNIKYNNVYIPILIPENLQLEFKYILKKYKKDIKNIEKENKIFFIKLNHIINDIYLKDSKDIFINLYNELLNNYEIMKDFIFDKNKSEGSLFYLYDKFKDYFAYIYNGKVYFFNILLQNNEIIIKKDRIFFGIYKKGINVFKKINFVKIKKINKYLVEKVIKNYYNINDEYIKKAITVKSIFKKDINNYIKNNY